MSRSSFSKAYEEMEMTFTVEDADLDKLNEVLKDINVNECPWFEVQDRHGNKARYYREPHWISSISGTAEFDYSLDEILEKVSKDPDTMSEFDHMIRVILGKV